MAQTIQIRHIQDDNRVFYDMPSDDSNPCVACGLCCSHYRVSFYCGELSVVGGPVPEELTRKVNDFFACMKGTEVGGGRCAALQGTLGQPGIGCAIYSQRPSVCREFPVWLEDGQPNPECQRLRQAGGLPPLEP